MVYLLKMFNADDYYVLFEKVDDDQLTLIGVVTKPFKMTQLENDDVLEKFQKTFTKTGSCKYNIN